MKIIEFPHCGGPKEQENQGCELVCQVRAKLTFEIYNFTNFLLLANEGRGF